MYQQVIAQYKINWTSMVKMTDLISVSAFKCCGLVLLLWSAFICVGYLYRNESQGLDNCASNHKLCGRLTVNISATRADPTTAELQTPAAKSLQDVNVYENRTSRISEMCQTLNISNAPSVVTNKSSFKKQSVLYCGILKVATTFMDGFLRQIFDCKNITDCFYRPPNLMEQVDKAYSFTIVRDPYTRLFSAYENKLFPPNKFWSTLGADVVATVRPKGHLANFTIGHDVLFEELVQYVVIKGSKENLNPHLKPMHKLCNPCQISFNFIGKLESMTTDINTLVADLNRNNRITRNESSSFEIEASIRKRLRIGPVHHLFSTLSLHKNKMPAKKGGIRRQNLFLRTWSSYQIRGVILKNFSMPFSPKEHVTRDMYANAILSAAEKSAPHKTQLKQQREEALIQAYRKVPLDLMEKLRDFVRLDCRLFGYDDMPALLFERPHITNKEFEYFAGL